MKIWMATFTLGLVVAAVGIPEAQAVFDQGPFDGILKEYVRNGRVDYARLKTNRQGLDRYVESLGQVSQAEYASWNEQAKIAFWINAYNAATLQVILDHYPIKRSGSPLALAFPANSIRQIPGQWDKITHTIMGRPMTLNDIEHGTLRKVFKEPRIHMALVCAAKGCPPLRSEAYDAARLNEQLDDQAMAYLSSAAAGFTIDKKAKTVALSSIFQWFGEDFLKAYGDSKEIPGQTDKKRAVLAFVSRHVGPEDRELLKKGDYRVSFLSYDWSLNEKD